jgi:chromosome transmission fidelity protein 18
MNLKHPVICICNNLYAPSLRKLRMSSENFIFYKTDINFDRILERLKYILQVEKVNVSNQVLENLVSQSEGDIRSCLNTLQFAVKNNIEFEKLNIDKDVRKNYFEIMKLIFCDKFEFKDRSIEFEEKYLEGCFENYLLMKFKDYDFEKTVRVLNSVAFCDSLNLKIKETQNFQLFEYLNVGLKEFNLNCKSNEKRVKFEYPKNDFEMNSLKTKNLNVVKSFHNSIPSFLKTNYVTNDLFFDVIPFLTPMLSPVDVKFIDFIEKKKIQNLANIHVSYGLEYKIISKNEFRLEPEIDSLFQFQNESKVNEKKTPSNTDKVLQTLRKNIQNEINLSRMKKESKELKISKPKVVDFLPITFRFNEGHDNAIKRNAKMSEF